MVGGKTATEFVDALAAALTHGAPAPDGGAHDGETPAWLDHAACTAPQPEPAPTFVDSEDSAATAGDRFPSPPPSW